MFYVSCFPSHSTDAGPNKGYLTDVGMSADRITDKEVSMSTEKEKFKNAEFQIIFISPEAPVVAWSGGACWPLMFIGVS